MREYAFECPCCGQEYWNDASVGGYDEQFGDRVCWRCEDERQTEEKQDDL